MYKGAPKGGLLARTAAALCKSPDFLSWLDINRKADPGTHTEQCARDWLCDACQIPSRAYLDHEEYAMKMFRKILINYDEYSQARKAKDLSKNGTLVLKKVLVAAKGAPCMRCGCANGSNGSTVACHYQGPRCHRYGKGTGKKPWDIAVAFLCMKCHALLDGYKNHYDEWMRSEEFQHYIILTMAYLIRQGVLCEQTPPKGISNEA